MYTDIESAVHYLASGEIFVEEVDEEEFVFPVTGKDGYQRMFRCHPGRQSRDE